MIYLLDANTYIQAKNTYYHMDICPAYWDWLDKQFEAGVIFSIKMVKDELKSGDDDLANWVKIRDSHFIPNNDEDTQNAFAQVAATIMQGNYNLANRDNFMAKADPWLIAKAMTLGATVVSQENRVPLNSKSVKIPNICDIFSVQCINTFQFLQELKANFVLQKTS